MSPAALAAAVELVAIPAREILETHLPKEHGVDFENFIWIITTALVTEALKSARGNKARAARMLGMKRNLLNSKIGELHLEPVVESALEAVKIAEHLQLNLFSGRKPSTPVRAERTDLSKAARMVRA